MAHARNQAARTQQLNPNRLRCPADTGKPLTRPPARRGRRTTRPRPCRHRLAPRLLNRVTARMPARTPFPAAGWTPATSNCVMPPCTRAQAFPPGLGVLARRGVTAWRQALAGLAPAGTSTAAPARQPGMHPAQAAGLPAPVAAGLINMLAALALTGAATTSPSP